LSLPAFNLSGKVAVVTGSTKGIGYGIAKGLAQAGATVVVTSRHQADCDQVAAEIAGEYGVPTLAVAADVTNLGQIDELMERARLAFGRIDILVNNAGSAITKRAEELTEADWDRVTNVDQKAVFFVAQAAGKQMIAQGGGKIINVASIMGVVGDKQILPYCVAKGGVIQMTKALALEWAKYNIQVNSLCPGYVITPMNEADMQQEKIRDHILKSTPMRRFGEIEDMTGPAVFLASAASNYMTGQALIVDGGWTAQ